MFITDAILHGMPPHIAQLVAGHRDINTTMGYKAVYPEEVISGHRAFISRRRAQRPSEEYRVPTDEEWAEFLGHFVLCTFESPPEVQMCGDIASWWRMCRLAYGSFPDLGYAEFCAGGELE